MRGKDRNARQKDASGLNLYMNDKIKRNVKCCKYLSILIDTGLKWQDHINYVYNKFIKFTSIFYKIRNKLPQEVLKLSLIHISEPTRPY